MNRITQAERTALVNAAKQAIQLDAAGDIIGGYEPAWRAFQTK